MLELPVKAIKFIDKTVLFEGIADDIEEVEDVAIFTNQLTGWTHGSKPLPDFSLEAKLQRTELLEVP